MELHAESQASRMGAQGQRVAVGRAVPASVYLGCVQAGQVAVQYAKVDGGYDERQVAKRRKIATGEESFMYAVKQLASSRAVGVDGLQAEHWKVAQSWWDEQREMRMRQGQQYDGPLRVWEECVH